MPVALVIITHDQVGAALLETATTILGTNPLPTRLMQVALQCDPPELIKQARALIAQLDQGDGVLVLTDMYGATPSNIACALCVLPRVKVVSGLNLPMLIRVLNYPRLGLSELADKALSGGREGIMDCRIVCLDEESKS